MLIKLIILITFFSNDYLSLYCNKHLYLKKIIVTVTNDLTSDQRVHKVCRTLHNAGYDVFLIGRKLSNSKPLNRSYRTKRISLLFNKGVLFYAEFNLRLFFVLLFYKKDVLLANDLDTLLPNYLISKLQIKKLVYDSHELFSEIPELVNKPFTKKVWRSLERRVLPKLKNTYTVSNSIADYYDKKHQTKFKVIRNLPLMIKTISKGNFSFDHKGEKIILYQGAINIGRGLELIINTMPFISNCILVIIGNGDIIKNLKSYVKNINLVKKVRFLESLTPNELQKITPLANIGISIEEDLGLNYRFSLPNKIFDYINAEVPILVSNLPEMRKIIDTHKVGEIVKERSPQKLALQIKELLKKDYSEELKKAKKELIWENQEEELLAIFRNII